LYNPFCCIALCCVSAVHLYVGFAMHCIIPSQRHCVAFRWSIA
jgi:hypothetical protein